MILKEASRQKHRGWASLAVVCKEWQAFIERKNFRRLDLQVPCLEALNHMVSRQKNLVQYICLNIELPRYTCRNCRSAESLERISEHSTITEDTMMKLFSALSAWQPTSRLTLELNAYSLSDSEHCFKNHHFGHNDGDLIRYHRSPAALHDPKHGWVSGRQVQLPDPSSVLRLFSPLCLSLPKNLPGVRAVTKLVIRRQLRRHIPPSALRLLLESLPRLQSLAYEQWCICQQPWQIWCYSGEFTGLTTH